MKFQLLLKISLLFIQPGYLVGGRGVVVVVVDVVTLWWRPGKSSPSWWPWWWWLWPRWRPSSFSLRSSRWALINAAKRTTKTTKIATNFILILFPIISWDTSWTKWQLNSSGFYDLKKTNKSCAFNTFLRIWFIRKQMSQYSISFCLLLLRKITCFYVNKYLSIQWIDCLTQMLSTYIFQEKNF